MKGSCIKRAWRAMKGLRKTKVVPLDPDLSDLQPDPTVQTHLSVLEPVVTQDIPVGNQEQTPLEDPDDPQPGPSGLQSAAPEEPAAHQPGQQTKDNKKKKGSRACFKRAWQSVKGTFSRFRKNKVAPFPLPCDPDPSVKTHLNVFQPVVAQDIPVGDFFTVSCNREQTPLEDPDDPQPGPSGLQSAAPEEPADHQPEKQSKENKKKKKHCSCFKRAWRGVKGTFSRSRKNKVAPFPSPSDPDPSVQTHLNVFQPVVAQDIPVGDFFTVSCNREQTPLEDPDDPQPGPSGLQSAAPEEPADHQPEKQSKENKKKKKYCSCSKRGGVKGTFSRSRKNKGAPFPSPSDPDPSDLQADTSDLQADPSDLQADPSVLEPIALEEPADSQPARSVSSLYELGKEIGTGYFGLVREGIRKSDGQKVAIKFVTGIFYFRYNIPEYSEPLFKEVALNLQLHKPEKCPYIVQMLDWFEQETMHTIVMEFPHPCLNLFDFLEYNYVSETLARRFMRQAVTAAQHWLDHGVNHGDLSLKNVLINTETLEVKIIDFGCGKLISTTNNQDTGYCDPAYAVADTVYGLGQLLKEINACNSFYNVVFQRQYNPLSEECKDLIKRSICSNLADRLTLDEFLGHEWFKLG